MEIKSGLRKIGSEFVKWINPIKIKIRIIPNSYFSPIL